MQELVAAKYSDIQYDNAGGFIITAKDNLRGCYFLNNKMVEPKYMDVNIINSGNFARVKTAGGKFGYISSNGIEFFEE